MTDKEYEELITRLQKDGLIAKDAESVQKQKSRKYFSEAYGYMQQRYNETIVTYWPGWGVAWDHVRRLTLWSYGARTQTALDECKKKEANERAKKFIDLLFQLSDEEQHDL